MEHLSAAVLSGEAYMLASYENFRDVMPASTIRNLEPGHKVAMRHKQNGWLHGTVVEFIRDYDDPFESCVHFRCGDGDVVGCFAEYIGWVHE